MLFSELNRINLNVLIEDSPYEAVPDISACYVHNAVDWTIFAKPVHTDIDVDFEGELVGNGWKVRELSCDIDDMESTYLEYALTDISCDMPMADEEDSDIVKIYGGKFEADGTFDYSGIVESEGSFVRRGNEFARHCHCGPAFGAWWTFNNGAFQWIGGPKSIMECRYSYGPFDCGCHHDPHHEDNNHKFADHCATMSMLPNLIFVFDPLRTLKGIVSLPCATSELREITQNYIGNLLSFMISNYKEITFKNFDNILKAFSTECPFIPTIHIAKPNRFMEIKEPVGTRFTFDKAFKVVIPADRKYIFPDDAKYSTFFDRSIWNSYSILDSFKVPFEAKYDDLDDGVTMDDIRRRVNELQWTIYYNLIQSSMFAWLSETYAIKPKNDDSSVSLMTISDMFKQAKVLNELKETENFHTIVLPKLFCDKEMLNLVANVKYL